MHKRFGKLPLATDLAPAIWYAEHGFPVMEVTAGLWSRSVEMLGADAESRATFLIEERSPRPGEPFRNPALARSLRRIAEQGRDGFYKGPTAQAIVDVVRERGGVMTLDDLGEFQPEWVEPIETTYRGWKVSELPPNGQGIAALEMLGILEQFPLAEWGFHSARTLHAMIEAKKLAYADLLKYIGDPRFTRIPVQQLLAKENAARRARQIDPKKAACHVEPSQLPGVTASSGSDTIYLTVVDGEGNIVSLIQSNYAGFGSGLVPKGGGFMLQNRGTLFTLQPGQPNGLAGRKRPVHTIIPAFMEKGDVRIGFGIMGGWNQAQAHAQFVSNVVDHGMNVQGALDAARFSKETFPGCDVNIEARIPEATRKQLTALGHELVMRGDFSSTRMGSGQAVERNGATGVNFGASDPRKDGAAVMELSP